MKNEKNTLRLVSLLKLDTPMGHVMTVFIDVESGGEELQHPKKFQTPDFLYLVLKRIELGIHKIGLSA